jgi:Helicase associated domain
MTQERLDLLTAVGFIWDSHDANWREKLESLAVFRREHGNCNVPSSYSDKKLATWIKCQRRQYKLYWDGKPSAMSPERILELEKVGFEWEIRSTAARSSSHSEPEAAVAAAAAAMAQRSGQRANKGRRSYYAA